MAFKKGDKVICFHPTRYSITRKDNGFGIVRIDRGKSMEISWVDNEGDKIDGTFTVDAVNFKLKNDSWRARYDIQAQTDGGSK